MIKLTELFNYRPAGPDTDGVRLNENTDYEKLVDALVNELPIWSKNKFVTALSKKTKYTIDQLGKVYDAYYEIGSEKYDWVTDKQWEKTLSKFGINMKK
jgi:hypothetical protein